jgi:putative transcriptional regulator
MEISAWRQTDQPVNSLANHFLIAMPGLHDSNFSRSVTVICHHDAEGAMGIIINQPLDLTVTELFSEAALPTEKLAHPERPVCYGGPVHTDHLFTLHDCSSEWESTLKINDNLSLTTSPDFLESLSRGKVSCQYMLALGYAGWGAGQLETEMLENSWIYATIDNDIIFNTGAAGRWEAAARLAGIDLSRIASYSGKA